MKIILRTQLMKIVLTLNFHVGSGAQPPLCSCNGHRIACSDFLTFFCINNDFKIVLECPLNPAMVTVLPALIFAFFKYNH